MIVSLAAAALLLCAGSGLGSSSERGGAPFASPSSSSSQQSGDSLLPSPLSIPLLRFATADTWAVIMSGSRYWHNYRHSANALTLYHAAKDHGVPDSRTVLMLSESYACDPRNYLPATVYNNKAKAINLHSCDAEVDVSGYEMSVAAVNEVLQGRYVPSTPRGRLLRSTNESNILVFLTGHGNQGFVKLHDSQYYTADDLADSFAIMHAAGRYRKILFIADTCNAESMCLQIRSPNVVCIASASKTQPSYSHHGDDMLGIQVIDTFAYDLLSILAGGPASGPARARHHNSPAARAHYRRNAEDNAGGGKSFRDMTPEERAARKEILSKSLFELFDTMPNTYPVLRPAINDPNSLKTWTLGEFLSDGLDLGKGDGAAAGEEGKPIPLEDVF